MSRRPARVAWRSIVISAAAVVLLTACSGDASDSDSTGTTPAPVSSSGPSAGADHPGTDAPLIPDDVIADLDDVVAAESKPIATTTAQTEVLPPGGTLDVLQLDGTERGGYLLRVRISWPQDTSLTAAQHRSLSLDGGSISVDGMRLADEKSARYTLPTVYAPRDEEQIDSAERFRCLCSDLVATVPAQGQILGALFGPLGAGDQPDALTVEVPGFEPITEVPVGRS